MSRVLVVRVITYDYPDEATYLRDKQHWTVEKNIPNGTQIRSHVAREYLMRDLDDPAQSG